MEIFEAVRTVLAVRRFRDTPIPEPIIREIVESGRLTASSINGQPWHFIIVEDRNTLGQLGKLASSGPYIAEAGAAIVVAVTASPFGVSDASRAIQSMILTAWSEGVGSNWVGFGHLEAVNPLLGIPPEFQVLAIVPLGYPSQPGGRGQKARKPLGAVASREHFGTPYS